MQILEAKQAFVVDINPIALQIGSLEVRWYGLMYLIAFGLGWFLARQRAKKLANWNVVEVDDLTTFVMLGIILGGRLGYILFYDLAVYLRDPLEIMRVWHGGMSFHGGLIGVMLAFCYFARTRHKSFLEVADFIAPVVPQGLLWGRIGNFINGELWGKISDLPWAMVFPYAGSEPRHPSQLYEAFLEGLVLFIILNIIARKTTKRGLLTGCFGFFYGLFRFIVEFVRMPDAHLGYLAFGWLTMGQILCLPLILIGFWLIIRPTEQLTAEKLITGTNQSQNSQKSKTKPKK